MVYSICLPLQNILNILMGNITYYFHWHYKQDVKFCQWFLVLTTGNNEIWINKIKTKILIQRMIAIS